MDAQLTTMHGTWRLLVAAVVALALVMALGATSASAASPTSCRVRNTDSGKTYVTLQAAVDAARRGDRFSVRGTCVGPVVVGVDLHLQGKGERPTLSGGGRGRVLEIELGSTVLLTRLTLEDGAAQRGGGILNRGSLTVKKSTIQDNRAGPRNGCGLVPDPTCDSGRDWRNTGGGIVNAGTMVLADTHVRDNEAGNAGGILNRGSLTMRRTTVSRNVAAQWGESAGGGIINRGTLTMEGSTIASNTVVSGEHFVVGGGIFNGGTLSISDSTISGNLAYGNNGGEGGGIANGSEYLDDPGDVTLTASTVTRNELRRWDRRFLAGSGVQMCRTLWCGEGAVFTVRASIIAGNGRDCAGPFISEGHNLIGVGCPGFEAKARTDRVGARVEPIDPRLGPLASNGGATRTHALLRSSPALDHGGPRPCATPRDQRGVHRPQVSRCDIGAFERR